MRISLGTFAYSCIEARFGDDVTSAVQAALRHYADRIEVPAADLPVPRFWLEKTESGEQMELEISIEAGTRRILETEARRRGLALETLVTHAVFVSLIGPNGLGRLDLEMRPPSARRERSPGRRGPALELAAAPWRQRR
jgi:hypothetical protein